MKYKVKFVYTDGKDVDLNIEAIEMRKLFEALSKHEIYWSSEDETQGLWLDLDKIRYIQCFALEETKIEESTKIDEGASQICGETERHPSGEGTS